MTDVIKSGLLGMWLGAALFFSVVVAPTAFSVLRHFELSNANEIAGSIVTRTLAVINVSGFLLGLFLLAATLLRKRQIRNVPFVLQLLSLVVLTITTAVGHWLVAARMLALRAAMSIPIDRVPADDPRRQAFAALHGYSVALLSSAMIAALVALVLFGVLRRSASDHALR